ncbi:uncharacterized protein LOC130713061 [Lotus japonicus]|uniref:uncharacterized protein LOC130713061 n=1 Tax=Lotus japonicus TaxID=34305 RepID=UPI0025883EE1|nr:uncharacterized protein LOC130713061 [Lotus japonicus]
MESRRRRRSEELEQGRGSPLHRVRRRLRREEEHRARGDDLRLQNDCLQEELEYYRLKQWGVEVREAEAAEKVESFSAAVREVAVPDDMRSLKLATYNGQTDPKDHLLYFNVKMATGASSDAVKCRMFPSTFKSAVTAWFKALPRGSIAKFRDLSSQFLTQFSASKIEPVTIADLYDIRQKECETLKQYVKRYIDASRKIEESEPQTCACAFKNGLLPAKLNSKLSRKPAYSMTEARAQESAYILEEEDDAFKKKRVRAEKISSRRDESLTGKWKWKKEANGAREKDVERFPPRRTNSLRQRGRPKRCSNEELAKLLQEAEVTKVVKSARDGNSSQREVEVRTKWCEYHHLEGHDTNTCFALKGKVGRLIRARRA